jgi:uncharacterized protein YndB with AHSA1/START domain
MSDKTLITDAKAACMEFTRQFDAPRDLVFRAHTEADLLVQWLGPAKYHMRVEELDVRDGGRYRYVHFDDDGNEFGFRGVFHGTPTPEQIHQTWEFEGAAGNVAFERLRLEEVDGRTILHAKSCYLDAEALEADLTAGMEDGMNEGYDRLDALLTTLSSPVG